MDMPTVRHVSWDLSRLDVPSLDLDVIIHAATPASAELNIADPARMFWLNMQAMQNVLALAQSMKTPPTVVFTSSGGVYGEMPSHLERFPEGFEGAASTLDPKSAYAEGKRAAEFLLSEATSRGVCKGVVLRLFAFSGVHLPIDRHFAIGNFVRGAVESRSIHIHGDGSPVRSYLDGADMAKWIVRACQVGESGFAYHIGSEIPTTVKCLAGLVASQGEQYLHRPISVTVHGETRRTDGVSRYVPDTSLTRNRLGVEQTVSIERSLDMMFESALRARDL